MTYTKPTEAQLMLLEPILAKLDQALEGHGITIEDTPEELSSVRYLLYSHWHYERTKEFYKIVQESPTVLRIIRRTLPQPRVDIEQAPPNPVEEFVLDHLQDEEDPEKVTSRLKENFSLEEVLEGVKLWRRLNDLE